MVMKSTISNGEVNSINLLEKRHYRIPIAG